MMRLFFLTALCAVCFSAIAEETFLCIPENSSGFISRNGNWEQYNSPLERKVIIKKNGSVGSWYEFGTEPQQFASCNEVDTGTQVGSIMDCGLETFGNFHLTMHLSTLRYTFTNTMAYIFSLEDKASNQVIRSTFLDMGSCSRI
jgi:hypothetical protein